LLIFKIKAVVVKKSGFAITTGEVVKTSYPKNILPSTAIE
jgi:hypothetical protein